MDQVNHELYSRLLKFDEGCPENPFISSTLDLALPFLYSQSICIPTKSGREAREAQAQLNEMIEANKKIQNKDDDIHFNGVSIEQYNFATWSLVSARKLTRASKQYFYLTTISFSILVDRLEKGSRSTKAGGFENRPSLSSKNYVHLVIYTLHAFKSLKLDTNPILLKLKYLDSAASALSNLYL
jgi:hypothetical protein